MKHSVWYGITNAQEKVSASFSGQKLKQNIPSKR